MKRINLAALITCGADFQELEAGFGISGNLTNTQFEQTKVWLNQVVDWTSENRRKDRERKTPRA